MAQRVYLLPVEPRIVELLGAAILEDSGARLSFNWRPVLC
jgi:hypothetical protein